MSGTDTIPRLHVTNQAEQTLALLLALHVLKRAVSATAVTDHLHTQQYWRGVLPDFEAAWQESCRKQFIDTGAKENYWLTKLGLSRLNDPASITLVWG